MRWHATHSLRLLTAGTEPNVPSSSLNSMFTGLLAGGPAEEAGAGTPTVIRMYVPGEIVAAAATRLDRKLHPR